MCGMLASDRARGQSPASHARSVARVDREILENCACSQIAGRARDRAAGVRSGARQVQALDPAEAPRARPFAEHLAVEDVPASDAEALLQLPRTEHEAINDAVG